MGIVELSPPGSLTGGVTMEILGHPGRKVTRVKPLYLAPGSWVVGGRCHGNCNGI